jgi:hypothetical protein
MLGRLQAFDERQDRMEKLLMQIRDQNVETKSDVGRARESIGFFYWVYKFLKWPAAITATATLLTAAISLLNGWLK